MKFYDDVFSVFNRHFIQNVARILQKLVFLVRPQNLCVWSTINRDFAHIASLLTQAVNRVGASQADGSRLDTCVALGTCHAESRILNLGKGEVVIFSKELHLSQTVPATVIFI